MKRPYSSITEFVVPYTRTASPEAGSDNIVDLENPLPSEGAQLPCPPAIEFLADIYESQGDQNGVSRAVQV